jgi:rubrerythrin
MKELGTFGAIVTFALDLENQALAFYQGLDDSESSSTILQLVKGSQKRLQRLTRLRQELVTEMILEPISGVFESDYQVDLSGSPNWSEMANSLEQNMGTFYSTTAPLIPMKEVERAFLRLAKENHHRVNTIN